MAIVYQIYTKHKNGHVELATKEIPTSTITIGRSAASEVRPQGTEIALNHARISENEGKLYIEDLESFSGTKVNGRIITTLELQPDDEIQIGPHIFVVSKEDGVWIIAEYRDAEEKIDEEEKVSKIVKQLDFKNSVPSMLILSGALSLALLVFFLLIPLNTSHKSSWSSGPMSNAHRTIGNDCAKCHEIPFQKVQDKACLACHNMDEHAPELSGLHAKHENANLACGDCHMEHNGSEGIISKEAKLCVDCHGSINKLYKSSEVLAVKSLEKHPEFRVTTSLTDLERVRAEVGEAKEETPLAFNHKVHLQKDLAGENGAVTLGCDSCHVKNQDGKAFRKITFETDCQSCHSLEFDDRLAGVQVPHGQPDIVFEFLKTQYAALALETEGTKKKNEKNREIPGGGVNRGAALAYFREHVETEARKIEQAVYDRVACSLCHVVAKKDYELAKNESSYIVEKPSIPAVWMPGAIFNHSAHDAVSCESCHKDVSKSSETSDVLLPGVKNCQTCHHDTGKGNTVVSDCVMCHSYHNPLALSKNQKKQLDSIFNLNKAP